MTIISLTLYMSLIGMLLGVDEVLMNKSNILFWLDCKQESFKELYM